MFLTGLNKGRTRYGSVLDQSCELRSVCRGLEKRQILHGITAGHRMGAQEHLLGCNRVASKMLQCLAQDIGSGLLLGVMNMGSAWPQSVQDTTFRLRVVCIAFTTEASLVQSSD